MVFPSLLQSTGDILMVMIVLNIFLKASFPEQTHNIRPLGEQLVFNSESFPSS